MTETPTKYTTPGSHNLHIPTQAEFQRYVGNVLSNRDFTTQYCPETAINETACALRWTYKQLSTLNFSAWCKSYK